MGPVQYSAQARADLTDIWVTLVPERGEAFATETIDRIERRAEMLVQHPRMGPARPEISAEARSLVVSRWLVLYRVKDVAVQVVRVVDGVRDLKNIAFDNIPE